MKNLSVSTVSFLTLMYNIIEMNYVRSKFLNHSWTLLQIGHSRLINLHWFMHYPWKRCPQFNFTTLVSLNSIRHITHISSFYSAKNDSYSRDWVWILASGSDCSSFSIYCVHFLAMQHITMKWIKKTNKMQLNTITIVLFDAK